MIEDVKDIVKDYLSSQQGLIAVGVKLGFPTNLDLVVGVHLGLSRRASQ